MTTRRPKVAAPEGLLLTHGAGSDKDHAMLVAIEERLAPGDHRADDGETGRVGPILGRGMEGAGVVADSGPGAHRERSKCGTKDTFVRSDEVRRVGT